MKSNTYKNWIAIIDPKTCVYCRLKHGTIYLAKEPIDFGPPVHQHCRCIIDWMDALYAGTATDKGNDGADWWLKWVGTLPDYYVSKEEAVERGYKPLLGNLATVLPGKMLAKGIYQNRNGHLPKAEGRIWYEADINYLSGYRGFSRIVWSNDGLVFVTYNHYSTFSEIV